MSSYRWVASIGILIALIAAAVHYAAATPTGPGVVSYIGDLGPVWVVLFTATAVFVVAALITGKARHGAHIAAAACLSTYATALWGTAIVTLSTRGMPTAGLATALAVHAMLLATVYSPRGAAAWARN